MNRRWRPRCFGSRFDMTRPERSITLSYRPISRACAIPIRTARFIGWRVCWRAVKPSFIARRMVIFASEDIGNADPLALVFANAVAQAVEFVGLPEARINLAHGTTYLASRPKDNASYIGLQEAVQDARRNGNLGVTLHLRNAVTSLMKEIGYGEGYRYVHDDPAAKTVQRHRPAPLQGKRYYRPRTS